MYKAVVKVVIYGDVLIIFNLYINYFLVRGAALLLRRELSGKRCLLAAAVGAVSSLVIMLPSLPFFAVALIKAAVACGMVFAAFGKQPPSEFALSALCFLVISFLFAGLMLGLWILFAPLGMVYDNGVAYFDIPIWAAVAFTAAGYVVIRVVRRFADRRLDCSRVCSVTVSVGESSRTLKGLSDTGNCLCDLFSGKPVIVCRADSISELLPQNVRDYLSGKAAKGGIRLLPCRTVSSETLIPIFRADSITIDGKPAEGMVGVSSAELGEGIECVFNPKMISL